MSALEQVLRDKIAWHEKQAHIEDIRGNLVRRRAHSARLAALTAALPAPGVDAPGDHFRNGLPQRLRAEWATLTMNEAADTWALRLEAAAEIERLRNLLAAAPSAPVEITQAQAQAMREALSGTLLLARLKWGNLDADANKIFAAADAALAASVPAAAR